MAISSPILLRSIDLSEEAVLQDLLESIPRYFQAIDGCPPALSTAHELLREMPRWTGNCQKADFFIESNGKPVGGIDILFNYPEEHVAFIGLFFIIEPLQNSGYGRQAYKELESMLVSTGIKAIECGVVDLNPVGGFWGKMGFDRVVREREFLGKHTKGVVTVLRKDLVAP